MKTKSTSQSAFFNLRILTAAAFCLGAVAVALSGMFSNALAALPPCCSWSAGPDLPVAGVRLTGVFFPDNGKFYAVGGRASDSPGSDFTNPFEYDPIANIWTTKSATYPDNQVNNMACGVMNDGTTNYIYCVGGNAAGAATATARVFRYNPITDSITALSGDDWPGDASGTILPGGFAVSNNKLYILGGFNINVASTNQIWEFNPLGAVGAKWTQKVGLPVGVMYAPTCAINGIIYMGGASDYVGGTVIDTDHSFAYSPTTNTWRKITPIPRPTGETRALNWNGLMVVLGGGRVAPNPSNQVNIYDPRRDSWTAGYPVPPFMTPRRNFPADTNGTDHIWLAGGYASDGVTPLSSMEIESGARPMPGMPGTPAAVPASH